MRISSTHQLEIPSRWDLQSALYLKSTYEDCSNLYILSTCIEDGYPLFVVTIVTFESVGSLRNSYSLGVTSNVPHICSTEPDDLSDPFQARQVRQNYAIGLVADCQR